MLLSDLRNALRQLRRRPGVTLVAVLALAVGIGGATAIFSVLDATLLRPLPYPRPDALVRIWPTSAAGEDFSASEPEFLDLQARNRTFAAMAAMRPAHPSLTGEGEPERLDGAAVTHTLFPLLGVQPVLGRAFTAAEDRAGDGARVALLSHELWQRRFGGDSGVVGRVITLDGAPFVVTGVLPASFAFAPGVDVYLPLAPSAGAERDDRWLDVVGRLAPGVTLAQARADLARVARELAAEHPATNEGWGVRAVSFADWLRGAQYRRAVWVLFGAVACLLLLACANVANLLVAQGIARQGELGIRAALGASRGRVVRQLFTESLVLALAGAGVGLLLAAWAVDAVRTLAAPDAVPGLADVALDGRVVAFALGTGVLTALLFGLLPALRAARVDVGRTLTVGARAGTGAGRRRLREGLAVAQIALAMVLLVGAGLMLTSFRRLQGVDTGLSAAGVLTVPLQLPADAYPSERQRAFVRELVARAEALPGVRSAAVTITNPYREWGFANDVTPADRAASAPAAGLLVAGWRSVTPGFFRTLEIPLLRGRLFDEAVGADADPVVVVSASLARRLWPGEEAVGKALYWGGTTGTPKRVVGVVGDVRDRALEAEPQPMLYLPYAQVEMPMVTLLVRTELARPAALAGSLRGIVWSIDPNLPVPEVTPLATNQAALLAGTRFRTLLLAAFAAVALLLAALGVYSVMAFAVAQRTREIGVRLALGARPAEVAAAVLRRGLALTTAGIVVGLAGSLAAGRATASLLYETPPTDAGTIAAVALLLGVTALLATWVPSRRATRVDPVRALRE
ncbi:MAG TPA: ABC transporter permease [Gemmatimonadaceae bacterium]|nr:ABC transporter permease [Gemmatimonadaceae bacterium]